MRRAIVTKFRNKFTLLDIKPPTRLRKAQTDENIAAVWASVNDNHQLSIRCYSQQLVLCYSTTWKDGARIVAERPTGKQSFR